MAGTLERLNQQSLKEDIEKFSRRGEREVQSVWAHIPEEFEVTFHGQNTAVWPGPDHKITLESRNSLQVQASKP